MIWLLWRLKHTRNRRFLSFAQEQFYSQYYSSLSPFYSVLKLVMQILAFGFLIIALAGPQWDYQVEEIKTSGLDIICAIDISRSMDATDMLPSRLARAKLQISSFIDELEGDRIGIIAFAGNATLEAPLTDDYEAVRMVISSLSSSMAVKLGTDIGSALDLAAKSFDASEGNSILILISDGENLGSEAIEKARKLSSMGVSIHTMGVGTESGTKISNPETGDEITSYLDVKSLSRIASAGGGEFFNVTPGQSEIGELLSRLYGKERSRLDGRRVQSLKDQYQLFLMMSLIFILIDILIVPYRKKGLVQ
jgi:Ca-activated chloride channel family protein